MCKLASFVVSRRRVWWHPTSDSHADIISKYRIVMEGVREGNAVPVEISPDDGDLSRPQDEWAFCIDVAGFPRDLPGWWDAEREERRVRAALVDWAKTRLTGWRVQEAFHPIHPFRQPLEPMTPERVWELVRQWDSVGDSVGGSVGGSVRGSVKSSMRDSVWGSVFDSVGGSVWDSVGHSVRASVWDSVGDPVRDSAWDPVGDSTWDSVSGYIGSLFPNITVWHGTTEASPWEGLRELWLSGRVPSFDGTTWRIHIGPDGRVEMSFTFEDWRERPPRTMGREQRLDPRTAGEEVA